MLKRIIFLISLSALLLIGFGCKRTTSFESDIHITLEVEYERLDSTNAQRGNVLVWFTYFVGDAQYGWYRRSLTFSSTTARYETTIDNAEAGKWLLYVRDGDAEVAQRIFLNGVELKDIVDGKARATVTKSGSVRSGW